MTDTADQASAVYQLSRSPAAGSGGPDRSAATHCGWSATPDQSPDQSPGRSPRSRTAKTWPLLVLAAPAAVAVWSGWVGIGKLTGFGQVHPLPGIWDSLHLDTAVTLPIGVEAYAGYALRAWLTTDPTVSARTRRFARRSAIGSLLLGMAGQIAYHLLSQAHATHAPWAITTAVSCLPVLVLGMGATLAHLLRADTHPPGRTAHTVPDNQGLAPLGPGRHAASGAERASNPARPARLRHAEAAAAQLRANGQRISRRTLRTAGLRGSNAELGTLARLASHSPTTGKLPSRSSPQRPTLPDPNQRRGAVTGREHVRSWQAPH